MKIRPALPALISPHREFTDESPPSSSPPVGDFPRRRLDAPPPSMTLEEWEASLPAVPLPRVPLKTIAHLFKGYAIGPRPWVVDNRKPKRTLWARMVQETMAKQAAEAKSGRDAEGSS